MIFRSTIVAAAMLVAHPAAAEDHRFEADPVASVRENFVACDVLSQLQRVMDNPRFLLAGECDPLRAGAMTTSTRRTISRTCCHSWTSAARTSSSCSAFSFTRASMRSSRTGTSRRASMYMTASFQGQKKAPRQRG